MRRIRLRRRNLCSVKQSGLQLRKNRKHRLRRQYRKKRLPCRYNRNERIPPRLKPNQFRKTRRLRFRRCRCGKNRRSQNAGFLGAGWQRELLPLHFFVFALPPPKRTAEANRQMVIAQQAAEREKREQEERRAEQARLEEEAAAQRRREEKQARSKHFKTPICPIWECRMRN